MIPRLRFLAPLVVALAAATTFSLAHATTRPTGPRTPHIGHPTVRQRLLGRNPSPIASTSSIASINSVTGCGSWATLSPHTAAFTRDGHSMVYDPVRDRMLIFGGVTGTPDGGASYAVTNEVWALSLGASPTLTLVTASGTPPEARSAASMIYDSVRDRLVIYGGTGYGPPLDDVWALSLSGAPSWTQIIPAGTPPFGHSSHSAIYDVTRDRMVVFGGYDGGGDLDEVWSLSFAGTPTWSQMTPTGTPPAARSYHTAVYDGPRDRMVVFAGTSDISDPASLDDTWALSLSGAGAWSQITPNGGPPGIRYGQTAIVDAPRNRMIVFGGFHDDIPYRYADVWTLSFTNPIKWTQLAPTGPTPWPAWDFASVYDPPRQRMISFSADECWAMGNLAGTPSWSMLNLPNQVPRGRVVAHTVYDTPRQRLLLFGGFPSPEFNYSNDLWAYPLNGAGGWTRIVPTGTVPPPTLAGTATYDPIGDRMIVFGGDLDATTTNDTWQLSLAGTPTWTKLAPSGTPPPVRAGHSAILDSPRNRIVVFGGGGSSGPLSDTWALSLAGGTSWSQILPGGPTPPGVQQGTAVFDGTRNRMLAFGGNTSSGVLTDVWALTLTGTPTWSIVTTAGTTPTLIRHVAAYDAVRDQMLVGMGESAWAQNTMYALTLSGTPTWGTLGLATPPPPEASSPGVVYDSSNDRMVITGGLHYTSSDPQLYMNNVVALSFPDVSYPLNVSSSPPAGGSVQPSPAGECYLPGTEVTLTAVPSPTYAFTGWSGDASGTANPITVTMNAAKNITANFDNYTLTVTISPPAGGSVSKNPNLANYPPNSNVTLTANAATGYGFSGWSGDASGSTNPLTLTMTSSKNVTATFVGYPVSLTISPAGAGSVTKNPNQATYAPGTQVTLTATSPHPFIGWSGDASGNANPLTITVDGPKNITASFEAYTISTTVTPTASGSIVKTPLNTYYHANDQVSLRAVPAPGYQFNSWSGDLTGTLNPQTLVINGNRSVTASFDLRPPTCGGWSLVPVGTGPNARNGPAAIWDPIRHRLVLYGGRNNGIGLPFMSDTWALTLTPTLAWTQLLSSSGSGLLYSIGLYDSMHDRMIAFGGQNGLGQPLSSVQVLSLSAPSGWTDINPAGGPQGRYSPAVIYDPPRDRLLLYGGSTRCGAGCSTPQNTLWQLTLGGTPTWTQLAPAGTTPPAGFALGTYDSVHDRMVVMASNNSVWELSLSGTPTWTNLTPWGAPHGSSIGSLIHDPVRDRVLLVDQNGSGKVSSLAFKGYPSPPLWAQVFPVGDLGVRSTPGVVYDSDHDLILLFGGTTGGSEGYSNITYRLDFGGGFFLDAGAMSNGTVVYDDLGWCYPANATATLTGSPNSGYKFNQWFGDASGTSNPLLITMDAYKAVRAEFVQSTTDVEDPPVLEFALEVSPNPSATTPSIRYALPMESRVRLRVFDVSGREVARLVDGTRPAGRHTATWTIGRGGRPPAGIYVVRLETAAGSWTRRFALLR